MIDYNKPILNKEGKPLKLLEAASHFCIRCIKKSRALAKIGYEIHGLGEKIAYGTSEYKTYTIWKNERQFKNSIKMYIDQGVDIIEFNNEPDHPVSWIREVVDDMEVQNRIKIVTDFHDLDSIRRKENIIPKPERKAINNTDGIIYVSLPIQKITNELHSITKPNICLYSYCNKELIDYSEEERINALIYEGGVNDLDNKLISKMFPYRNLFPIFKQLIVQGNEVHAIVGNTSAYMSGQNSGVVLHPPMEYDTMMKELSKYKWGILIFNNKGNTEPQVKYTLTNKAQEYMAAGVPSLACWCEESERWVRKHDVGITFNDVEEIGNCSQFEDRYKEIVNNIKIKKNELVMENFIWRLENLYAELLSVESKGIPDYIKKLSEFEYGLEVKKMKESDTK